MTTEKTEKLQDTNNRKLREAKLNSCLVESPVNRNCTSCNCRQTESESETEIERETERERERPPLTPAAPACRHAPRPSSRRSRKRSPSGRAAAGDRYPSGRQNKYIHHSAAAACCTLPQQLVTSDWKQRWRSSITANRLRRRKEQKSGDGQTVVPTDIFFK